MLPGGPKGSSSPTGSRYPKWHRQNRWTPKVWNFLGRYHAGNHVGLEDERSKCRFLSTAFPPFRFMAVHDPICPVRSLPWKIRVYIFAHDCEIAAVMTSNPFYIHSRSVPSWNVQAASSFLAALTIRLEDIWCILGSLDSFRGPLLVLPDHGSRPPTPVRSTGTVKIDSVFGQHRFFSPRKTCPLFPSYRNRYPWTG